MDFKAARGATIGRVLISVSIDFGDGTCDEWATKTWDVALFPEYPSGSKDFSVFSYGKKK